jgi:hypothetical protein
MKLKIIIYVFLFFFLTNCKKEKQNIYHVQNYLDSVSLDRKIILYELKDKIYEREKWLKYSEKQIFYTRYDRVFQDSLNYIEMQYNDRGELVQIVKYNLSDTTTNTLFVDIEKLCRSSIHIEDEKLWQDSKVKSYILSYFNNCSQCHSLATDITSKQMLSYDTNNFSIKIRDIHKKNYYSKDNTKAISNIKNMSKEEIEKIKNFLQYIVKNSKNKY